MPTMLERFIAECKNRPNECWNYPGYCNKRTGYGNAYVAGQRVEAHTGAYRILVGPIPEGMELDHLCRNRACCNPAHLEPVSHRLNLLRGDSPAARQARQTHCIQGHALEGENLWVDRRGRRHCVPCRNRRTNFYYHRKVALRNAA